MAQGATLTVSGYALATDRLYDPDSNLWLDLRDDGSARIGFDPLGAETTGDIVAISFVPIGTRVTRGEPLVTVEAAKFVGPLGSPIGGVMIAGNDEVALAPGRINADPLGAWLVELGELASDDLELLLSGEEAVAPWFAAAVERFRREGAIAE
jgi:glycine cleavage system H protein